MQTITELLNRIHILLEKDVDFPISGDEEYLVRFELIKDAVQVWEKDDGNGTKWKELFTSLSSASDGDKTTTANDSTYDCPANLVEIIGYVKIGTGNNTIYYKKIEPYQVKEYQDNRIDCYYVTGNKKDGFDLHLVNTIPSEDGLTIDYDYYKTSTLPTAGTDVLEMDDDQFAVYWALAELVKDEDPSLSSQYASIATQKLDAMRLRNQGIDLYQDNIIRDSFRGFGR